MAKPNYKFAKRQKELAKKKKKEEKLKRKQMKGQDDFEPDQDAEATGDDGVES